MSPAPAVIPEAVSAIWCVGLLLSLHRTWRSARSIQRYAAEALQAAVGVERNTRHVRELDETIAVASDMLGVAGAVERKLDTVAGVLEQRSR